MGPAQAPGARRRVPAAVAAPERVRRGAGGEGEEEHEAEAEDVVGFGRHVFCVLVVWLVVGVVVVCWLAIDPDVTMLRLLFFFQETLFLDATVISNNKKEADARA